MTLPMWPHSLRIKPKCDIINLNLFYNNESLNNIMLTNGQILSLINGAIKNNTETNNVEFKDARGGLPGNLWKSVSSFSHKPGGGIIAFGFEDNKNLGTIRVVGGLNIAKLQELIVNYLREQMINPGGYELNISEYQNHAILVLQIEETKDELKPCYKKSRGLPNGACIREGNTDRVIADDEMRLFIRNSNVYKYDREVAPETSIDMLSTTKIEKFLAKSALKSGRPDADNSATPDVMKNIGIADDSDNKLIPTIAGYLIFAKDNPQKIKPFSRYTVRCVKYKGVSAASPIIDRQEINGTLDEQIDLMQTFILRNISLGATILGTKRVDRYEYPAEAIRELIVNAIAHRDYMISETYVQVNIFSNRIEISNPGNLPPGVTIENIKEAQFSRNEVIAETLKDMEYLEEYGRGIDIVFSKMQEWELLEPIFKNISNKFIVILLGPIFKDLNERQIKIWHILQERKQINIKTCREIFPDVSRATISNDVSKLVKLKLIAQKGSSSNTFYEPLY